MRTELTTPSEIKTGCWGNILTAQVVLILRYSSADEAVEAMKQKEKTDYSYDAIRKRAETDASFKADTMTSRHGSSVAHTLLSADTRLEVKDRVIHNGGIRSLE